MRWLIVCLIPVAIYPKSIPLTKNGIQLDFAPEITSKVFDTSSSLEVFYTQHILFLRGNLINADFRTIHLRNEVNAGFCINSQWFIGAGTEFIPVSEKKNSVTLFIPTAQVLFENDAVKTYFQIYFNGNFSWGAILFQTAIIPIEIGTHYHYSDIQNLKMNLAVLPIDDLKTGLFYTLFRDNAGIEISALLKNRFQVNLAASTNILKKYEYQLSINFTLFFNEMKMK